MVTGIRGPASTAPDKCSILAPSVGYRNLAGSVHERPKNAIFTVSSIGVTESKSPRAVLISLVFGTISCKKLLSYK